MTESYDLNVVPEDLRVHAQAVLKHLSSITESHEASQYVSSCNDGFGDVFAWIPQLLLAGETDKAVSAISKLKSDIDDLPDRLRAVADAFDDKDTEHSKAINDLGSSVEGGPR